MRIPESGRTPFSRNVLNALLVGALLLIPTISSAQAAVAAPPIPARRVFAHNETVQMMEHPPSGYSAVELRPMVIRASPETRLHAMFVFPGKTLTLPPGQVSMAIVIRAATLQFGESPSVQLMLDQTPPIRIDATVRQFEHSAEGAKETVAWRLPRAVFLQLASSRRATVRIDDMELTLSHAHLEALRDLASRMSPEGHRAGLAAVPVEVRVEDFTLRVKAYESGQVDSAARPSMVPILPKFPEGAPAESRRLFIHYVVDTSGRVDMETVGSRTAAKDSLFLAALREVMPFWEFSPAVRAGVRVRQVVRQVIAFDPEE